MKKIAIFLVVVFITTNTISQTIDDFYILQNKVESAFKLKDYDQGFMLSKELLLMTKRKYKTNYGRGDTLVYVGPFIALIGHAIYYAQHSGIDSMCYYMNIAIDKGFDDSFVFLNYFDAIYPVYYHEKTIELKNRMDSSYSAYHAESNSTTNLELSLQLKEMFLKDQYVRKNYKYCKENLNFTKRQLDSLIIEENRIDSINQIEMVKILDTYGYPGVTLVGYENFNNAFFIIQHFSDLSLQKKYFPMLQQAAKKGELDETLLQLLTDRILIREGKKQKYGTQYRIDEKGNRVKFKN